MATEAALRVCCFAAVVGLWTAMHAINLPPSPYIPSTGELILHQLHYGIVALVLMVPRQASPSPRTIVSLLAVAAALYLVADHQATLRSELWEAVAGGSGPRSSESLMAGALKRLTSPSVLVGSFLSSSTAVVLVTSRSSRRSAVLTFLACAASVTVANVWLVHYMQENGVPLSWVGTPLRALEQWLVWICGLYLGERVHQGWLARSSTHSTARHAGE
ncbi:MAG: hypothetical protein KF878_15110 [Planctomycetes bacterium]|nr:hypothetical protein [Planctomycetota bacterium]